MITAGGACRPCWFDVCGGNLRATGALLDGTAAGASLKNWGYNSSICILRKLWSLALQRARRCCDKGGWRAPRRTDTTVEHIIPLDWTPRTHGGRERYKFGASLNLTPHRCVLKYSRKYSSFLKLGLRIWERVPGKGGGNFVLHERIPPRKDRP